VAQRQETLGTVGVAAADMIQKAHLASHPVGRRPC
jgi:hypothetical protein